MKRVICTIIGLAAAASLHAQVNPSFVAVERYDTSMGVTRLEHFPMGEHWRSVIVFFIRRADWPTNASQDVDLDTRHNISNNRLEPAQGVTLVQVMEPLPPAIRDIAPVTVVNVPKIPKPTRSKPRKAIVVAQATAPVVVASYVGGRL